MAASPPRIRSSSSPPNHAADSGSGFNDASQVVFYALTTLGDEALILADPPVPVGITVTATSASSSMASLNWTTSPAGTACDVHRTSDFAVWTQVATAVTSGTYTDPAPPAGGAFYVIVAPSGTPFP